MKNWQAPGGEIQFTVRAFSSIPPDAQVLTCFRWATATDAEHFIEARPTRLDLSSDGKLIKVATNVPHLGPKPANVEKVLFFVPRADVRILAIKDKAPVADVDAVIGITNPFWAIGLALITLALSYASLAAVCRYRCPTAGISFFNPIAVITTPNGYASLSQLQIVLWTFVVAVSAVYVMALSGDLIQLTTGTLVLLGISGLATVGAKLVNPPSDAPAAPAVLPGQQGRRPIWSDLVVNETWREGVLVAREIDVTRVQMLCFTLITATFVVLRVLTTYVIPEIPENFQILMGLSNAVYMGSKIAQK